MGAWRWKSNWCGARLSQHWRALSQDVLHLLQDELRLNSWVKDYPFLLFFLFRPFNLILKAWEQDLETWSMLFLVCWWQSQVSAQSLPLSGSRPWWWCPFWNSFSYRNDEQKQNFSVWNDNSQVSVFAASSFWTYSWCKIKGVWREASHMSNEIKHSTSNWSILI